MAKVIKNFKMATSQQIAKNPELEKSYEGEGKAAISLLGSQLKHLMESNSKKGKEAFTNKQLKDQVEGQSQQLVNNQATHTQAITYKAIGTDPHPPTPYLQPPNQEAKGYGRRHNQEGQGKGWLPNRLSPAAAAGGRRILHPQGLQWQGEGQRQRQLQGKGQVLATVYPSHSPILNAPFKTGKKNRRMKKWQLNRMNRDRKRTDHILIETQEMQLMKLNLRTIGVAERLVHNLTDEHISEGALNCLALGPKFIPQPQPNPDIYEGGLRYFKRAVRIRYKYKDDSSEIPEFWIPSNWQPPYLYNRLDIEAQLAKLSTNLRPKMRPNNGNIDPRDLAEYKAMLEDPNILVILADKNLGYVVVNRDWYIDRCMDHLNSDGYTEVTDAYMGLDEGVSTLQALYEDLNDLVEQYQHHLDPQERKWILQKKDFQPSRFYITAKVHKQPVKGRPIVPSMTWLTYHLSQWAAKQLNPMLIYCEWVLKDSYQLLGELEQMNTQGLTMHTRIASADVDALYPSMDIQTGLGLMRDFLNEIDWDTPTRRTFLLKAMEFILTQGYLQFNGRIYQQTNGAAMGSPMIPPYANIFMYQLEKNVVRQYRDSGFLLFYRRFIDDIFIITKTEEVTELKNALNSLHPAIKLSWTPMSKRVNFLDLWISINGKEKLETQVYQKALNPYAYLPFHSYHTPAQKTGFIKGEAIRYARISTKKKDYLFLIQLFTLRLQKRGYPLSLIKQHISKVLWEHRAQYNANAQKSKKLPLIFKTTYNPAISHSTLRDALNSFTHNMNSLPNMPDSLREKITICYKLPPKLHTLTLKARKEKEL